MMRPALKLTGIALVIGLAIGGAPAMASQAATGARPRSAPTCEVTPPQVQDAFASVCVGTDPNNPFVAIDSTLFVFDSTIGGLFADFYFYADKTLPGISVDVGNFGPIGFNILLGDLYLNHGPTFLKDGTDTSVLFDYFLFGFGQGGFHEAYSFVFAGQTDYNKTTRHPKYRITTARVSTGAFGPTGASVSASASEYKTSAVCTDSVNVGTFAPVAGRNGQATSAPCPQPLPDVNGQ
ncbi:MAG: hypothetical protein ACYDCC_02725 [Actinomycetota bacterium]